MKMTSKRKIFTVYLKWMGKLFKFNRVSDKHFKTSRFKSVCRIHVECQPGLAAQSEDTGCTNKRRSKWISRLWRPRTRCLCPISCVASRKTEDMKISESTQPAALTWWTFFYFLCLPLATASTFAEEKENKQTQKKTLRNLTIIHRGCF